MRGQKRLSNTQSTFPYLQKSKKTFGVFHFILYFCTQKFY